MKCMPESKANLCIKFMLAVILVSSILAVIALSLVPPTTKDELVHHLAVPKLYIEHGGIYEIPFAEYSYYPMNLELLYAIPLYFGNDIVPKFIHFVFALLTALLIYYYLRSRTNLLYALFGSAFYISVPIIVKLSTTAYIDLGEIFFSFAALLLIIEWMKKDFRLKYLIYSGMVCGLALGTKYNGLITFAILALLVPFIYARYGKSKTSGIRTISYAIIFAFVSLVVFSPWMIRDYHWKGNPIYPLYNQIFNPPKKVQTKAPSQSGQNKTSVGIFGYRTIVYKETGLQIAALPLRVFFQGKDGEPKYFDGRLNPFLLILSFFAFYKSGEDSENLRKEKKALLIFSVLFFTIAFFTVVLRVRYISPIIPPLIVLSIFGLQNLFRIVSRFSNKKLSKPLLSMVFLMPCITLFINGDYIRGLFKSVDPVPFITGKISRDEYITKHVPEYPVVKYINQELDANAKILFVLVGNRGYYCDRQYTHDMGILQRSISISEKAENIGEALKKKGITHLFIGYRFFKKWMDDNFTEEKKALTQTFFNERTILLYSENGFGVLVVK
jgi:4-amino-4-deoxy-L-arabinose transferase-like glycosyltransferase